MLIMCVRCSRRVSCSLKHNQRFLLFLPPSSSLSPNRIHLRRCHPALPLISPDSPSLPISCFCKHKEHIVSSSIKVNPFSLAVARPGLGPPELGYLCFPAGTKVAPRAGLLQGRFKAHSCSVSGWRSYHLLELQSTVHLVLDPNVCTHWRFHFLLSFPKLIAVVLNAEVEIEAIDLSFFPSFFTHLDPPPLCNSDAHTHDPKTHSNQYKH